MRRLLRALMLVSVWMLCALVHAQGADASASASPEIIALKQGVERISLAGYARVWVDDSGTAGVQEANAEFDKPPSITPPPAGQMGIHRRQEGQSYDLHGKAMWLQFSAHNLQSATRWLLQVELPTTDSVTLFYQRSDGSWVSQSAGDSLPQSQWALRSRYPLFSLSDNTGQPVAYLL
jgi:two-component system, sensor histidine kinase LadS